MFFLKLSKIITFLLCIIIATNIGLFCIAHSKPPILRNDMMEDLPYLFHNPSSFLSNISDFAACGDYLYVLFESRKVLSCYNTEGEYLHSYAFNMRNNGQSRLYVKDNVLYLESREHIFYCFRDGDFVKSISPDISELNSFRKQLSDLSRKCQIDETDYFELRGSSLWRVGKSTQEIIHRPFWYVLFQGNAQLFIFLFCLTLIVILNAFSNKTRISDL